MKLIHTISFRIQAFKFSTLPHTMTTNHTPKYPAPQAVQVLVTKISLTCFTFVA
jgi:hypothetical protein